MMKVKLPYIPIKCGVADPNVYWFLNGCFSYSACYEFQPMQPKTKRNIIVMYEANHGRWLDQNYLALITVISCVLWITTVSSHY